MSKPTEKELRAKIKETLAFIQESIPDFKLSEEQISTMISSQRIAIHEKAKKIATDEFLDFVPHTNAAKVCTNTDVYCRMFARTKDCIANISGTKEADHENLLLFADTDRTDERGVIALKKMYMEYVNSALSLNPDMLYNPEKHSIEECFDYCIDNYGKGNFAWEMKGMASTNWNNRDIQAKDHDQYDALGIFMQSVGSTILNNTKLARSEFFLTFPFEYLTMDQMNVLYAPMLQKYDTEANNIMAYKNMETQYSNDYQEFKKNYTKTGKYTINDFTTSESYANRIQTIDEYVKQYENSTEYFASLNIQELEPSITKLRENIIRLKNRNGGYHPDSYSSINQFLADAAEGIADYYVKNLKKLKPDDPQYEFAKKFINEQGVIHANLNYVSNLLATEWSDKLTKDAVKHLENATAEEKREWYKHAKSLAESTRNSNIIDYVYKSDPDQVFQSIIVDNYKKFNENIAKIQKIIPDFKLSEERKQYYLSADRALFQVIALSNQGYGSSKEQRNDQLNKLKEYLPGGAELSGFGRCANQLAKMDGSKESEEYNKELFTDLERKEERGIAARKKVMAECANSISKIDFEKFDSSKTSQYEKYRYCIENGNIGSISFEMQNALHQQRKLFTAGESNEYKLADQVGQSVGMYMSSMADYIRSSNFVSFPIEDLTREQLDLINANLSKEFPNDKEFASAISYAIGFDTAEQTMQKDIEEYTKGVKDTGKVFTAEDFKTVDEPKLDNSSYLDQVRAQASAMNSLLTANVLSKEDTKFLKEYNDIIKESPLPTYSEINKISAKALQVNQKMINLIDDPKMESQKQNITAIRNISGKLSNENVVKNLVRYQKSDMGFTVDINHICGEYLNNTSKELNHISKSINKIDVWYIQSSKEFNNIITSLKDISSSVYGSLQAHEYDSPQHLQERHDKFADLKTKCDEYLEMKRKQGINRIAKGKEPFSDYAKKRISFITKLKDYADTKVEEHNKLKEMGDTLAKNSNALDKTFDIVDKLDHALANSMQNNELIPKSVYMK